MPDALQLLKAFCEAYFVRRDQTTTLTLLTNDIRWFGASGHLDVTDLAAAAARMREECQRMPSSYALRLTETASAGPDLAFARLELGAHGVTLAFRVTAAARQENGAAKLCALHLSVAGDEHNPRASVLGDMAVARAQQAQLDNLINAMPGGVAKYRCAGGKYELLYQSDGLGRLLGHSREEYARLAQDGAGVFLYPEDAPLVFEALDKAAAGSQTRSLSYRILHKNGEPVWITGHFKRAGEDRGCPVIHAVFTPLSSQGLLFQMLVEHSASGVIVRDEHSHELLYTNQAARDILHAPAGSYAGQACHKFLHGQDAPCPYCKSAAYRKGDISVQALYLPASNQHLQIKGTIMDWAGREAVIQYIDDVTEAETSRTLLNDLIGNVTCGLLICEVNREQQLELRYMNDGFFAVFGETREALTARFKENLFAGVHPEDLSKVRAMIDDLTQTRRAQELTYRYVTLSGKIKWITLQVRVVPNADGTATTYSTYFDVTEQQLLQQQLSDVVHTVPCGICLHRWDGKTLQPLLVNAQFSEMLGEDALSYMQRSKDLTYTHVHPEDLPGLRQASLEALLGTHHLDYTYRSLNSTTRTYLWVRLRATAVPQPDGGLLVYASYTDVTQEHTAEQELRNRYELEKKKPSLGEGNLLLHALFNLNTGETLEYVYQDGTPVPPEERTAFTNADNLDRLLIDADERQRFRALNTPQTLLERFARGETSLELDYRRCMPDGQCIWVRNIMHLLRDPASADILLFEYCYDVEAEVMEELMYRSLASDSYDYVARINGKTRHFTVYAHAELAFRVPPAKGEDADAVARQLSGAILAEDREMAVRNTLLDTIGEHLRQQKRFQFTYREVQPDGSLRHKKITQYYLDPQREIILMCREDITSLIQAETAKNQLLANALEAARQASRAKSQFLSRMSHELRTPMNAIIGLAALAADEVENPAATGGAIEKIGLSARFLLSLINDILEMSRIESGRLTLNEGPFDFAELLASVNTIIHAQAARKGLDYDVAANGYLESTYIGDTTKLQQVLVNVLGNAVKYTPAGGKVSLAVEQVRRTGAHAVLRFTVSDTGVGIDEAFLPHLFDPFAQEAAGFTSTASGTGLGLAISKSVVEMMNGRISVHSIKHIGSVFTIEVRVGVTEDRRRTQDLLAALHLSRLKALVVDDDMQVCKNTEKILSDMGLTVELAGSGAEALERVTRARADRRDYDTIFIDWQMPGMDGIETTRRIRAVVGPDVTIVIMTAFDWKSIEAQARAAGVDLFMDKPLFPSTLVSVFAKLFGEGQASPASRPAARYDFSGRRILLAEDHPLNVEVARRLLEKTGASVVVAANGLEALEAFTTADSHFFDAILMDIRMPLMDGLTAARNIRNLKKQGSREIPIIAMTANAFDEDVERSLAHGMDAHLIKPIDPQLLFSTLHKLMRTR